MSSGDRSIEALLRWRLARAEADAPPPPSAALLLELARPWWEVWPERLRARLDRLAQMPLVYGYAMTALDRERAAHPVPTIIAGTEDVETRARVTYFSVREGRLRLRFRLEGAPLVPETTFESTFVSEAGERALFMGTATLSQNGEYRVDVALPDDLVDAWTRVRVTDPMPFRFILLPFPDAA
jgi:hypothetical protein